MHTVDNEAAPASTSAIRYTVPDKWNLRAIDFFDDKSLVLLVEVTISAKACESDGTQQKGVCSWFFTSTAHHFLSMIVLDAVASTPGRKVEKNGSWEDLLVVDANEEVCDPLYEPIQPAQT